MTGGIKEVSIPAVRLSGLVAASLLNLEGLPYGSADIRKHSSAHRMGYVHFPKSTGSFLKFIHQWIDPCHANDIGLAGQAWGVPEGI